MESEIIEFLEKKGIINNFKKSVSKYGFESTMWLVLLRSNKTSPKIFGENTTNGSGGLIRVRFWVGPRINKLVPSGIKIKDLFDFLPPSAGIYIGSYAYILRVNGEVVNSLDVKITKDSLVHFHVLTKVRTNWSIFERENAIVFNYAEDNEGENLINIYRTGSPILKYKWSIFSNKWNQLIHERKHKEYRIRKWHKKEFLDHSEFYKDLESEFPIYWT